MANQVIKPKTGHIFISPYDFISYSEDFYEACCSHVTERAFSPAKYYLAGRSIELSLKAFLLIKGVTRDKLKKSLGHDLHKLLRKCKELGIVNIVNISEVQEGIIENLNTWYARKGFEYFELESLTNSPKSLPDISSVQDLANFLIEALKEPCIKDAN